MTSNNSNNDGPNINPDDPVIVLDKDTTSAWDSAGEDEKERVMDVARACAKVLANSASQDVKICKYTGEVLEVVKPSSKGGNGARKR